MIYLQPFIPSDIKINDSDVNKLPEGSELGATLRLCESKTGEHM